MPLLRGFARGAAPGTVQANENSIDYACTRDESCYWEVCQEPPTNDPRLRQCYTPYVECSTEGYTCGYSCVSCEPLTSSGC